MLIYHNITTLPIEAIVFDCDGTLSYIEGIDELAKANKVAEPVVELTAAAMGQSGLNPELYNHRLNLVKPNLDQMTSLGNLYFQHRVMDILPVIQILKTLRKSIYIISAGLYPAVQHFGALLGIEAENIFAVNIHFDAKGHYLDFDRNSPLIYSDGKRTIIQKLKLIHNQIIHIGDGLNDYVVHDLVTRFIGYGGAFYRENIAQRCHYYISIPSMAPLLPLCLTAEELIGLTPSELTYYQKGLDYLNKKMSENKANI